NQANGEGNRDGESHNRSWNMGIEGETDDPAILHARARQQRNFLATLMLSQGVPMLLAGDSLGRTQRGNNNAYCQDNEVSWIDWGGEGSGGGENADGGTGEGGAGGGSGAGGENAESGAGEGGAGGGGGASGGVDEGLLAFTRALIAFRHAHPVFSRRRWFQGQALRGTDVVDIGWFTPNGEPMSEEDWRVGFAKSLAVFLN